MAKAIRIENLSKAYQLGDFGTGTISRDLERFWARMRGKEDPFLKIGEVNDRTARGKSDIVWSLKDLTFDIEQGDAVGIIGRNGAGKSTLLKVLSRVTSPTTGSVKIKGRIASLLEVGTGFHPELTGKENIYLNGAILGMRKAEIKRKFDEIVDFAGVERYIDTPVKRYSSGMYMRLAFAVAAHLESEILIVDEVLAVGDTEFQKKCLGKMGEISKDKGKTILFVSHNMEAVNTLCNSLILMERGEIQYRGNVADGYNLYQKHVLENLRFSFNTPVNLELNTLNAYITSVELLNSYGDALANDELLSFKIIIKGNKNINNYRVAMGIRTGDGKPVGLLFSEEKISLKKDEYVTAVLNLKNHNLTKDTYSFDFSIGMGNEEKAIMDAHVIYNALTLRVTKKHVDSDSDILIWNKLNWGNNCYNNVTLQILPAEATKLKNN